MTRIPLLLCATLAGCMTMPADPSRMSPEQIRAMASDRNVTAVCAVLMTPWGPQRSALLSVDKQTLQSGAVAIDESCKLQYISQPVPTMNRMQF